MGSHISTISETTSAEPNATVHKDIDDEGVPEQKKVCSEGSDCFVSGTDQQRYQSLVEPNKPAVAQDVVETTDDGSIKNLSTPPAIKIKDGSIGATAAYKKTTRYDGPKYPDTPAEGEILVGKAYLSESEKSAKRTLAHELTHHRFDHITQDQQRDLVETFKKSNSIEGAKKFLFDKDDFGVYEKKYNTILKKYGEEAAEKFVVDETIAPLVGFRQYPATVAYVNEPRPAELKQLVEEMGSLDAVKKGYEDAGMPWHLPNSPDDVMPIVANRPDIPADECTFYRLQGHGIKMTPELEKALIENDMIPTKDEVGTYHQNIKTMVPKMPKRPS